ESPHAGVTRTGGHPTAEVIPCGADHPTTGVIPLRDRSPQHRGTPTGSHPTTGVTSTGGPPHRHGDPPPPAPRPRTPGDRGAGAPESRRHARHCRSPHAVVPRGHTRRRLPRQIRVIEPIGDAPTAAFHLSIASHGCVEGTLAAALPHPSTVRGPSRTGPPPPLPADPPYEADRPFHLDPLYEGTPRTRSATLSQRSSCPGSARMRRRSSSSPW